MQLNAVQWNATRCNMQQEQDSTSNTSAYVSFSYDESAILGYKCMNFLLELHARSFCSLLEWSLVSGGNLLGLAHLNIYTRIRSLRF